MKIILFAIFISLLTITCNHASKNIVTSDNGAPKNANRIHKNINDISIITLIANPQKYEGDTVRIKGYLNLEFEGNAIYIHKEDYESNNDKNGLWVEMTRNSMKLPKISACNKHYVLLEGTFSLKEGHMASWSGSIENITRLEIWKPIFGPLSKPTK